MEKNQTQSRTLNHSITIDNNKNAVITGVVEVVSSTDRAVVARTDTISFQLLGESLRVSKLDLGDKICHVEGSIYKLEYNRNGGKGLMKRLFK